MKQCIKCGELKQLDEFVKRGTGTRNTCKACYNLSKRKTPEKPIARDGYKFCAACGIEKPLSDFNKRLIAGKKRPFSYCKQCERNQDSVRFYHKCEECGEEYYSGRKDSKLCKKCHHAKVGQMGRINLMTRNIVPEKNPWYGKPRYGSENPNYKPDKTDNEREAGRIIPGYKEWVKAVYEKDRYTCQRCGDNRGGNLNAHHLDGYSWCKEKRTDISNGVTLCEKCHLEFHRTYGYNNNTKEQFYKFKQQFVNK